MVRSRSQKNVRVSPQITVAAGSPDSASPQPRAGPWPSPSAQSHPQYFSSHLRTIQTYPSYWTILTSTSGAIPQTQQAQPTPAEPCHYGEPCTSGLLLSIIAKLFFAGNISRHSQPGAKSPSTRSRCLSKRSSTRSDRRSYKINIRYDFPSLAHVELTLLNETSDAHCTVCSRRYSAGPENRSLSNWIFRCTSRPASASCLDGRRQ